MSRGVPQPGGYGAFANRRPETRSAEEPAPQSNIRADDATSDNAKDASYSAALRPHAATIPSKSKSPDMLLWLNLPGQVENKLVIEDYFLPFPCETAAVGKGHGIWDISPQNIHPLRRSITGMQSDSNSDEGTPFKDQLLRRIHQARCNPLSPGCGYNIDFLDLRNTSIPKRWVIRLPDNLEISLQLLAASSQKDDLVAAFLRGNAIPEVPVWFCPCQTAELLSNPVYAVLGQLFDNLACISQLVPCSINVGRDSSNVGQQGKTGYPPVPVAPRSSARGVQLPTQRTQFG